MQSFFVEILTNTTLTNNNRHKVRMKIIRRNTILLILVLVLKINLLSGQVTIGTLDKPVSGALLQLSEGLDDNGANSTKGLLLPRVLLNHATLEDVGVDDADLPTEGVIHTGLTVYNPEDTQLFCEGLYTWDGTQWKDVMIVNTWLFPYTAEDASLPNSYIVKPGETVLVNIAKASAMWKSYGHLMDRGNIELVNFCTPPTAKVLWTDNPNLIEGADATNGWELGFADQKNINVSVKSGEYGNALIGIYIKGKNANGDIEDIVRWSWHIWVPEGDPTNENVGYRSNNGRRDYFWMDRNLGAKTAYNTVATTSTSNYGLFYQWGRKDPFTASSNNTTPTDVALVGAMVSSGWSVVGAPADKNPSVNLRRSITSPEKMFPASGSANDWWLYTNNPTDPEFIEFMDTQYLADSEDRWNSEGNKKSPWDPCPEGWRVPAGSANSSGTAPEDYSPWDHIGITAANNPFSASNFTITSSTKPRGRIARLTNPKTGTTQNIFFPAAGRRIYDSGRIVTLEEMGFFHTARKRYSAAAPRVYGQDGVILPNGANQPGAPNINSTKALLFGHWGAGADYGLRPYGNMNNPSAAVSVRCVKE